MREQARTMSSDCSAIETAEGPTRPMKIKTVPTLTRTVHPNPSPLRNTADASASDTAVVPAASSFNIKRTPGIRRMIRSRISASATSGRLSSSDAPTSRFVLKAIHASAGSTRTWRIAGIENWLNVRTKTIADRKHQRRERDTQQQMCDQPASRSTSDPPRAVGAEYRATMTWTSSATTGQTIAAVNSPTPIIPYRSKGKVPLHLPARPKRCSHEFVTRNGGTSRTAPQATYKIPRSAPRAALNPSATHSPAGTAKRTAISEQRMLFKNNFIGGKPHSTRRSQIRGKPRPGSTRRVQAA